MKSMNLRVAIALLTLLLTACGAGGQAATVPPQAAPPTATQVIQAGATQAGATTASQVTQAGATQVAPTQPAAPTASQVAQSTPTQSGASDASPLDTLDPCTVVTQDDAKTFFGVPSAPGQASKGAPVALCVYATPDNIQHLSLNLRYVSTGALTYDDYVQLKSDSQNVSGLGDGAFYNATIHILYIAKGPWFVKLSGNVAGATAPVDKLSAVAKTVLGRLP